MCVWERKNERERERKAERKKSKRRERTHSSGDSLPRNACNGWSWIGARARSPGAILVFRVRWSQARNLTILSQYRGKAVASSWVSLYNICIPFEPFQDLDIPLPIQPPAKVPGKQRKVAQVAGPHSHIEDPEDIPGSQFQLGSFGRLISGWKTSLCPPLFHNTAFK